MTQTKHYDFIIVGSGQAGVPLATDLASAGHQVAVIERNQVGGTCVNWGCTPTKTMVASARIAYLTRRARDFGVYPSEARVQMPAVRARKQKVVEQSRSSNQKRLSQPPIDLIMGDARFMGEKQLEVHLQDGIMRQLTADIICINVGLRPAMPPIEGLDRVHALDSTSIMDLDTLPEHLIVLGGGYIGVEFGQMFRRFGSEVTLIERGPHLLGREDTDVSEEVARILSEDGITVLLNAAVRQVEESAGRITVSVERKNDGKKTVTGSQLLVALGRVPNTATLNLAAAGVETDEHGYVKTNERLETNVAGIYALGDVKGGPAFTHISYDDYRILAENLLCNGNRTMQNRLLPYCVFIDPELGRVGLSEKEAKAQGRKIRVAKIPMTYVARAIEMDETRGFMKAIVDAETQQILGCAILGVEGGEIMSGISLAMMGKLPYTALRDGIFAHPTMMESLNTLFSSFEEE